MIEEIRCKIHQEPIILIDLNKFSSRQNRICCLQCLMIQSSEGCIPMQQFCQKAKEFTANLQQDNLIQLEKRLNKAANTVNTIKEKIIKEFEGIEKQLFKLVENLKILRSYCDLNITTYSQLEFMADLLSENQGKINQFHHSSQMMINLGLKKIVEIQREGVREIQEILSRQVLLSQIPFNESCCVLASNQSQNMIVGGRCNQIIIWSQNGTSLHQTHVLSQHNDTVSTLIIYPNGEMIVSGGERNDRQLIVWKRQNDQWNCIQTLKDHKDRINDIQLSKNEEQLISASNDKLIKIWKMQAVNNQFYCFQTIADHDNKVYWASINQQCQFMVSSSCQNLCHIHQYSKNWKQYQKIITEGRIDRVFFINDDQFLMQQASPSSILIYSRFHTQYQLNQQIHLFQSDNDDILFPVFQFNNTIYLKNNGFLYLVKKKTNKKQFFIESTLQGQFRSGCIDTTGKYVILRNFGNKTIDIWKLNDQLN